MKAKTIKMVLRKKLDALLESIDDDVVKDIVAKNTIVTGGCIASMLLKENVNDYDLYFKTQDSAKAVAEYYVKKFDYKGNDKASFISVEVSDEGRVMVKISSAGVASEEGNEEYSYFEQDDDPSAAAAIEYMDAQIKKSEEPNDDKAPYRPVFFSSNAITLSGDIQLVLRFYGEPDEIHENYDFVHCTNYWSSWDNTLVLHPDALEALLARELRYVGSKYPLCSLIRVRKFVSRGWSVNAGQILKMAFQLNELDLFDISILKEQLVGVDMAYFAQLVGALKEKQRETGEDKVDGAYLTIIIDRLFS